MEVKVCVCSGVVRMVFDPNIRISHDIKVEIEFKKDQIKKDQTSLLGWFLGELEAQKSIKNLSKINLGGVPGGLWRHLAANTEK